MNQKVKVEGSHNEWDQVWKTFDDKKLSEQKNLLFTKSEPNTILQFWQKCYFEDLKTLIEGRNYKKFLELGSGRGTTSMYLATEGIEDITMVDLAENAFALANYNFKSEGLTPPKMILANVEQTRLPSETYDCIYNIGLLEHFENPSPTIKESYRLLKEGGMIFMPIVPKLPFSKSIISRLLFNPISIVKYIVKKLLFGGKIEQANGTMIRTSITKEEYLKIAKDAGFTECYCISYNPYWKVNKEGWFENNITLLFYKIHYKLSKKISKSPFLKTSRINELCYLLVGYKK